MAFERDVSIVEHRAGRELSLVDLTPVRNAGDADKF